MNQANIQQNNQNAGFSPQYTQYTQYGGSLKPQNDQFNKGFFAFYKAILVIFSIYFAYNIVLNNLDMASKRVHVQDYLLYQFGTFLGLYGMWMAYQAMKYEDMKKSKKAIVILVAKIALYVTTGLIYAIIYNFLSEMLPNMILNVVIFCVFVLSGAVKIHLTLKQDSLVSDFNSKDVYINQA